MITLTEREASVLGLIGTGLNQIEMAEKLNIPKKTVSNYFARLRELGAIKSTGGKSEVLVDCYKTVDKLTNGTKRAQQQKVEISDDEALYIRNHYNVLPRSRIAERLGVSKVTFNLMCLQLGMGE
ncbi:hypothetical protein SD71_10705 [Cohnella kolymensis]|uniref:HTH luxR-type domain-containing protein n=1 Tax=Cohnella kolymensis TaxID=1590652 RepID=A0ABR5A4D0_9BACL|nr:LuxR C-terminal-related transcriptional regulator [Cohnella kolymensis]KIL35856.1 hypothetical protein SD71_10705 [Cohnella kolymensis]